ncbi:M48 family metalloprotease [Thiolinea disciformis]|uniref:M48 family metalloprotease n=1 Tax=Thiolinea disciformis TaxID=125614 RepID=UPI00036E35A8|nr:M48 family metalloprotease [Thiolinea disciformis]
MSQSPQLALLLAIMGAAQAAPLNLELPPSESLDLPAPLTRDTNELSSPALASAARSASEDQALGRELLRSLRRDRPIIEDPELKDWLQSIANRLALHTPNRTGPIHVLIENNGDVNARTMLGGVIIVNSGLILNSESESELAGVLAHEMAHISQRHIDRLIAENRHAPVFLALGLLAGAVAASQSPEAAQAVVTGTAALQAHKQIVFGHRAESEADRLGLRILAAAAYDPQALGQFLEKLDRNQTDVYGDIGQYLRTHPLNIDRLSDTRLRANQLGRRSAREDRRYLFAREKLRQLTNPSQLSANTSDASLATYRQALQAERAGQTPAILQKIPQATQQLPLDLLRARALIQQREFNAAHQLLNPLKARFANDSAVILLSAEAQAGLGQAGQATALLLNSAALTQENTSLEFFEIGQRLAQQANLAAEARLFNAERSIRLGEYLHAQAALREVANQATTAPSTAVKIRNRLNEIEAMLRMQKYLGIK